MIFSFDNESERTNLLSAETKRERSTGSNTTKKYLVVSYKGTAVAIKHVLKKNVEIDRDLKKQLQLRKELNHDNITRFIGACVETPHVYILTQFCQRGSLEVSSFQQIISKSLNTVFEFILSVRLNFPLYVLIKLHRFLFAGHTPK